MNVPCNVGLKFSQTDPDSVYLPDLTAFMFAID